MAQDLEGTRSTRPRNRRAQIITAAAELFHSHGYDRVGMADIARSVGITGGALYRHFDSKQDLLREAVAEGLRALREALSPQDPPDFDVALRQLTACATEQRQLGVLMQRELRHLPSQAVEELSRQLADIANGFADSIRSVRPDLEVAQRQLLARFIFSACSAPSYVRAPFPKVRLQRLLADCGNAIVRVTPTAAREGRRSASDEGRTRTRESRFSRREELLTAAVDSFAARGYGSVTMADIGEAVGITAPSVYNHFSSKDQILNAALWRGHDWLQMEATRVLANGELTSDALHQLLASYVEFAFGQTTLVQVLITEVHHLPEDQFRAVVAGQNDYVGRWVGLLRAVWPQLDAVFARYVVQAVLTVANDFGRLALDAPNRAALQSDVITVGKAMLACAGRE